MASNFSPLCLLAYVGKRNTFRLIQKRTNSDVVPSVQAKLNQHLIGGYFISQVFYSIRTFSL